MKKGLIDYYAVVIVSLFIIYNIVLESLKIGGLLYQFFMVLLVVVNAIILIAFRKNIKYKSFVMVIYFLVWIYSKNVLQCFFNFSNIIALCLTGFMKSKLIKVITLSIMIFVYPILFIFLLAFGTNMDAERGMNGIYSDTHYYCDNNYEVYSFSGGAFDSFHYSIGKYYEILNIDGIINISYRDRNLKTKYEYENYLKTHNCVLVGDINEFR